MANLGLIIQTFDEITARYPELAKLPTAASPEVQTRLVQYAEAHVHGRLAQAFSIPFSLNNLTAKDLVIDTVYVQNIRTKVPGKGKTLDAILEEKFVQLCNGQMNMVSVAGTIVQQPTGDPVYSNTSGYHPVFGMGDSIVLSVDSNQLINENNARGSPVDEAL